MLKTLYFDLGNVLVFFDRQKMFHQTATCTGLKEEEIKKILIDYHIQEQYEKGEIDSVEIYHFFKKRSQKQFSLHEFIEAISDIFSPNQELWNLVKQLKQNNLRLILLSNTCESHYNKIYSLYPIVHLFDHKVLSFEVGSMKPESSIFQKAITVANCPLSECFYVDDISTHISAARKMGLDSEVFIDVPTLKEQLIARGCDFLES